MMSTEQLLLRNQDSSKKKKERKKLRFTASALDQVTDLFLQRCYSRYSQEQSGVSCPTQPLLRRQTDESINKSPSRKIFSIVN